MTEEAKAQLKLHSGRRLLKVVIESLQAIALASLGQEVLREAVDYVKDKLATFIKRAGNDAVVEDAMSGQLWSKLQNLVSTIEDDLDETHPRAQGMHTQPIGKNTKAIIVRALLR